MTNQPLINRDREKTSPMRWSFQSRMHFNIFSFLWSTDNCSMSKTGLQNKWITDLICCGSSYVPNPACPAFSHQKRLLMSVSLCFLWWFLHTNILVNCRLYKLSVFVWDTFTSLQIFLFCNWHNSVVGSTIPLFLHFYLCRIAGFYIWQLQDCIIPIFCVHAALWNLNYYIIKILIL